jgi:phospholipase C
VLITWDEGGGFFDHVAPPASPAATIDADDSGNRIPYGTRALDGAPPFSETHRRCRD